MYESGCAFSPSIKFVVNGAIYFIAIYSLTMSTARSEHFLQTDPRHVT